MMAPAAITSPPSQAQTKLYSQQRRFSQSNVRTKIRAQSLIGQALEKHIGNINPDECEAGGEDGFFVADLGEIYRQHMRWKVNLPRIEPFYGMSQIHLCLLSRTDYLQPSSATRTPKY